MKAVSAKFGSRIVKLYACAHHRERGDSVCKNTLRRAVADVDSVVLDWLKSSVLTEEVIAAVLLDPNGRRPPIPRGRHSGRRIHVHY